MFYSFNRSISAIITDTLKQQSNLKLFYGSTGELFISGTYLHAHRFLRTQEKGRGVVLAFHWNRKMELPNYSSQLMQQLWTLRKEGHFCDCTILVGESPHRAHKLLLAASSMLFRYLLLQAHFSQNEPSQTLWGLNLMCPFTADIWKYYPSDFCGDKNIKKAKVVRHSLNTKTLPLISSLTVSTLVYFLFFIWAFVAFFSDAVNKIT